MQRLRALLARPRLPLEVAVGVLVVGALARIVQYAAGTSLWFDEALLWLNLDTRSFSGLLDPLDRGQGAPPGFLLIEKAVIDAFGDGERALRLLPFVCGLLALPLALVLARRVLTPWGAAVAMVPVALSPQLIEFSALTKQYSGDLLAAVAILLVATFVVGRTPGPVALVALALIGPVAVALSHPALFVLAGVGVVIGGEAIWRRDLGRLLRLAPAAVLWIASAVVVYLVNIRDLRDVGDRVTTEGSSLVADNPLNPLSIGSQLVDLFHNPVGLRREAAMLGLVLAIAGAVALARRRGPLLMAVVAAPLGVAVALAVLEQYPLSNRFTLYLVPTLALLLAEGLRATWRASRRGLPVLGPLLLVAVVLGPVEALGELPRAREELAPALAYVREHQRPGDIVFLHHPVQYAFAYYGPRAGFATRPYDPAVDVPASEADGWYAPALGSVPPVIVGQQAESLAAQVDTLSVLRGRPRVWVVFTHPQARGGVLERPVLETELDRLGTRLERRRWTGAQVSLYDLSPR